MVPSGVECIGQFCFMGSEVEELTFPSTLREISDTSLRYCSRLRVVWVEKGCPVDPREFLGGDVSVRYT